MATAKYNEAFAAGYTLEVAADCDAHSLTMLVKPDTDYDGEVRGFDVDEQVYVTVNGWLWTFETL